MVRTYYYLADGIYPKKLLFALCHPEPRTRKENIYSANHISARKAVERVFGVLFRQFRIIYVPGRTESLKEMETVMKECCILHNMIARARGYRGTMKFRQHLEDDEKLVIDMSEVMRVECQYEQGKTWRDGFVDIDIREKHGLFTEALMANVWNRAGDDD